MARTQRHGRSSETGAEYRDRSRVQGQSTVIGPELRAEFRDSVQRQGQSALIGTEHRLCQITKTGGWYRNRVRVKRQC